MRASEVGDESYQCQLCAVCSVKFWIPASLHEVAKMRGDDFEFWCPNGHGLFIARGEEPSGEVVKFQVIKPS